MSQPEPWHVDVAGPARRALARLAAKAVAPIVDAFRAIATNPRRLGKPLRFECEGLFVARRGPYRIIYDIDAEKHSVTIVAVGRRADVYRS
ncbi:MAG: type II toxin-antitoxin system RelE/ParE family toxin [Actinomycetota bacterium]|nr:type II toxin-antitoxin system RelE/ParE family toxin [Actinomycetota bacterium]